MTKPMVIVTKHRDAGHLTRRDDDVLCVDALTLADDLEVAYFERLKPKINGDFKSRMETRFREFREAYWQDREKKKNLLEKIPLRSTDFERVNQSTRVDARVNSPARPAHYSTNVSTTGFDDPSR
jgi:hypothetical protein